MKQFRDCIREAEAQQRAADREWVRRRRQQDQERLKEWLLRILFLILLAVALGVALFRMEPVQAAASEIFSMERIVAGMNAPDSVDEITVEMLSEQEDFENQKIVDALLGKAHCIENCTVTWYTANTCNKQPGDSAYGITYSELPVVEHMTCAVDPDVIPLYSDVFVQYADGTIEQLWATDTGVSGNAIDIYTPDYDYAIQCGRQSLTVWWVEPLEGAP